MNSYFHKYLCFEKKINDFIKKDMNDFFTLPKNYEIVFKKKDKNTIFIQIKWNYNYKVNIQNIPQEINNLIEEYLHYTILLELELEFFFDIYFQLYIQWKFINFSNNNITKNNSVVQTKFYQNILNYRNIINRRRHGSIYKYVYEHCIENEFISLIADINEFEFIFK